MRTDKIEDKSPDISEAKPVKRRRSSKTASKSFSLPQPVVKPDNKAYRTRTIDAGKALTLRLKGNSYEEIAKICGASKQAVHDRLKRFSSILNNPPDLDTYERNKDRLLTGAQFKLLSTALDDKVIKKSSTLQLISSYGILFDKQRLIRGEATVNIAAMVQDVDKIRAERAILEAQLRTLSNTQVVPSQDIADTPDAGD